MGISAIDESVTSDCINDGSTPLHDSKDWTFLACIISALVIGILFSSNFALGIAVGTAGWLATSSTIVVLNYLGFIKLKSDSSSDYLKYLTNFPLTCALLHPIIEESLFRGVIQPLLTRAIVLLVPATTAAFMGTALSVATTVSIVAIAALFGFAHIFNDHKNSHIQAISAGIISVPLGILAVQFGLTACIAAHIALDAFPIILMMSAYKPATSGCKGDSSELIRPENCIGDSKK